MNVLAIVIGGLGLKEWRKLVTFGVNRLISAPQLDHVVLGGGNARNLKDMPPGCRTGNNAYSFMGGFRLWETGQTKPARNRRPSRRT
jgi:polyphosphate glucokinase